MLLLLTACSLTPDEAPDPVRGFPQPVRLETDAIRKDKMKLVAAIDRLDRPEQDAPSVVVIVLDTLRADRLGPWGGSATPNLDAFAAQSRVYTQVRSNGAWTLPSHGSLFTGLHPRTHGAHGSPADAPSKAWTLREDVPTLAERMGEAGYNTVGVAANQAFLDPAWGLSRGFDLWFCHRLAAGNALSYPQADRIAALGEAAVRFYRDDAPLFLFLNFMDAHTPWIPREGYTVGELDPRLLMDGQDWEGTPDSWEAARVEVQSRQREATDAERAAWSGAYDAEVRFLDEHVGALLRGLEAHGHGPEDYTIILSDHGEFLGEHQLLEHSKAVYEEVIRVPLIIRGPGFEPGVDGTRLQTHDVPNVLLAALGEAPLTELSPTGAQVTEQFHARHRDLNKAELAERFDVVTHGIVREERKLIVVDGRGEEAYELSTDPGERRSTTGEWVEALRAEWTVWDAATPVNGEHAGVELSAEQEELLRALGYME